mgnify:CR=1 FL=1
MSSAFVRGRLMWKALEAQGEMRLVSSAFVRGRLVWWRFVRAFTGSHVISSATVDVDVELGVSLPSSCWLVDVDVDVELGVRLPSLCWLIR